MKGTHEDHDGSGPAEQQLHEWDKPELEVIPMSEAMTSPTGISSQDAPFGYS